MQTINRFFRLTHISYVLFKHGLDEIVLATHLFRPVRFLVYLSPSRISGRYRKPRGVRIREALEELGPIFVKFGQVLSTRPDIVPEDIVLELVKLQDKVPPFPGDIAQTMIEKSLNRPIHELFHSFDIVPLASASIAQVHSAVLPSGKAVVVKVLRPNVHKMIEQDVSLIKSIANLANRYWKNAKQFKPKEIVAEFERALYDELDLMREAANASELRRNFQNSKQLYIPEVYWPYTKHQILVMERIYGIPILNIEALKEAGIDLKTIAEQGVEIFFTQVFRDCFFHADMHPGNLMVSTQNVEQPKIIAVDFGIMGSLGPKDQRYLAENFLAFFNRDYRRVAELHVESGWVPPHTRVDEFASAIRTVCEPIFERPIKDISFGTMLLGLFQTARRFEVVIQPQLVLLQKTLLNVEGLGRQLYPDLDLWTTAKPFLEKWMKTQIGPQAFLRKVKRYGPYWLEKLPDLPNLLYQTLENLSSHEREKMHSAYILSKTPKHSKMSLVFGILIGIVLSILGYSIWRHFG